MNSFPKDFTPAGVARQYESNKNKKEIEEMTKFEEFLSDVIDKKDTCHEYKMEYKSIEMSNAIIAKIRSSAPEDTQLYIRQFATVLENGLNNINELHEIKFWFCTEKYYTKYFNNCCNIIRQKIMRAIESESGPEYVFTLNKHMTKSVEKVLEELKALGWKIEAYNNWDIIKDDSCHMKLTLSSE
jgi:hypothetical protein